MGGLSLKKISPLAGAAIGAAIGGPAGAMIGGMGGSVLGDLFGSGENDAAIKAQADFIRRMMGREGDLYPEVRDKLKQAGLLSDQALNAILSGTGPAFEQAQTAFNDAYSQAQPAFQSAVGEVNKLYPGVQEKIGQAGERAQRFELAPEALNALNELRDTRLNNIKTDADKLMGGTVADLARRGVISSSTMEGGMGDIMGALQPAVNATEADYWNSRLALPGQEYALAKDTGLTQYNLGKDVGGVNSQAYKDLAGSMYDFGKGIYGLNTSQAGLKAGAYEQARSDMLNPYLDLWKTTAGAGATTPGTAPVNTSAAELAGTLGAAGLNYLSTKKPAVPPYSGPSGMANNTTGASDLYPTA